jgi:acyl carrier protein
MIIYNMEYSNGRRHSVKKAEFYARLASMLELSPGAIKGDEALDGLEQWDSLARISFIAFCDKSLSMRINPKDLAGAKTVADLTGMVRAKVED